MSYRYFDLGTTLTYTALFLLCIAANYFVLFGIPWLYTKLMG